MPRADEITRLDLLRTVDPGVVGGLVVERASVARDGEKDRALKRYASLTGVEAGLAAGARGKLPGDRRTELPGWLRADLRRIVADGARETFVTPFPAIRTLEILGLLELDPDDDYVLCMVSGLSAFGVDVKPGEAARPVRWVAADPQLVDKAIWRLFEVEGGGSVSLTNLDDYVPSWRPAFLTWVQDGTLSRARVLDATLRTLSLDFAAFRARWYAGLLDALEASPSELAERQDALRALLRSEVRPTVKLGVRHLRALERDGLLDGAATAPALAPAVRSSVKGTALDAVRLLGAIHRRNPEADVVTAAQEGLGHESPEVQRAAATLLRRVGVADVLADDADLLAPSVRRELGLDGEHLVPGQVTPEATSVTAHPVAPVELPAVRPAGQDLLERLAAVLEDPSDAIELELVLDGLARLGDGAALRPLHKRALSLLGGHGRAGDSVQDHLAAVVLTVTGGRARHHVPKNPRRRFLHLRLLEVEAALTGRRAPCSLLATPDDPRGFVSPSALVARLVERGGPVASVDLIAALLRLGAEGREDALASVTLDGELGDVLRHALGAPPPAPSSLKTPEWWVAASRARAPLADDPLLLQAGLSGAGQGRPIRASLVLEEHRAGSRWDPQTYWAARTEVEHPARIRGRIFGDSSRAPAMQPTATEAQARHDFSEDFGLDSWSWVASIWPHDAEHVLVEGVGPLVRGAQSTSWDPDARAVLDALARHPGQLGRLAAATAALGLTQTSAEDRLRAVDWVAEVVPAGRLGASDLALAMAVTREVSVGTRWAESLRRVAEAGAAGAVVDVLTHLLPHLERGHRGLHALLDVLHQELLRSGRRASPPELRVWLGGFSGSSKSARTAKALLAL